MKATKLASDVQGRVLKKTTVICLLVAVAGSLLAGTRPASAEPNNKICVFVSSEQCNSPCQPFYSKDASGAVIGTGAMQLDPKWVGAGRYACSAPDFKDKNCCTKNVICSNQKVWNPRQGYLPNICYSKPDYDGPAGEIYTCYTRDKGCD